MKAFLPSILPLLLISNVSVKLVPIKEYFGQDDIVALNVALRQHGGASSFTFQGVSVVLAEDRYIVPQLVFCTMDMNSLDWRNLPGQGMSLICFLCFVIEVSLCGGDR